MLYKQQNLNILNVYMNILNVFMAFSVFPYSDIPMIVHQSFIAFVYLFLTQWVTSVNGCIYECLSSPYFHKMVKSIFWNFNFMKILTFKIYTHTGTERFLNNPQNWWWWWIWSSISFQEFFIRFGSVERNENILNEIYFVFLNVYIMMSKYYHIVRD